MKKTMDMFSRPQFNERLSPAATKPAAMAPVILHNVFHKAEGFLLTAKFKRSAT